MKFKNIFTYDVLFFLRVSGPNYRANVTTGRRTAELARANADRAERSARRANAVGSRLSTFPASHDPAGTLRFVLCKIRRAGQCVEAAVGGDRPDDVGCIRCTAETAAHMADALSVLSSRQARAMISRARCTLPPVTYDLLCEKYAARLEDNRGCR